MLSAQEIEIRKTGIGASEIGAVAGLSPYAGPLDVYLRKAGLVDDVTSEAAEWGHALEPLVADRYARETGATLRPVSTMRHPREPWILATPDRIAEKGGEEWLVEVKTASIRVAHRWGEPYTDEVPEEYLAQVTWQMLVTGHRRADVALLIGGQEFRIYSVPYDEELAAALVETGRRFWLDHVIAQVPPEQGSVSAMREYLRRQYPRDERPIRDATPEEVQALEELRQARAAYAAAAAAKEAAEDRVRRIIGESAGLQSPIGRVTWKKTRDTPKTDWRAAAMEAGVSQDLIEKHTTIRPGPRVLRCTFEE